MFKFIRVIVFLSMIDGYNSTENTDQRLCAGEKGRVEKTDPHSADYPLTPVRGLLYGLLRGLLYGLVRGLPCGLP